MPPKNGGGWAIADARVDESVMELQALNRRYAEQPWLKPASAERSFAEIERMLRQAVTLLAKHADTQNG
jgi:hypothetical protein